MKKYVFIYVTVFALAGISCIAFVKSPELPHVTTEPTLVILEDAGLSMTLHAVKNGSVWEISGDSAAIYLSRVASIDFSLSGVENFHDIQIEFISGYTKGILTGIGSSRQGADVPIGVHFVSHSQSGTSTTMGDTEKHTCTGNPCSCCRFLKNDKGEIYGCRCEVPNECQAQDDNICNHTITQ